MKKLFILSVLIGFSPLNLMAQEFTGNIVGVVNDSSGAVVPGATVTVSGETIQGVRSTVTESNGAYRLILLPPGTYKVTYELQGFATLIREGVLVGVGRTSTINVALQVATLSETTTVTGETPVVDLQSVARGVNYDEKLLTTLPIGSRNLGSVLTTMPGIQVTAYDVGGSNMGTNTGFRTYGLSGQWNVRVDGVTTQDTASNLNLYFDYGALSEMQVAAAVNSAESNVPGAAVNMTVKSGSNQLHSGFLYDWEGKSLQSNNTTSALQANGIGITDQFAKYHDLNLNGGGPITKDKLWWFYSYRDQGIGLATQMLDANGHPGAIFLTSLKNHTLKLNYQLSPNNSLFFTGMTSRKLANRGGRGPNAYLYTINSTGLQWTLTYIEKGQWNRTLGNRATFEASEGAENYDAPYTEPRGIVGTTPIRDLGAVPIVRGSYTGESPGLTTSGLFRDSSRKWEYRGALNYFTAAHNIKTSYGVIWVDRRSIHHGALDSPGTIQGFGEVPQSGVVLYTTNGVPTEFQTQNTPFNFQSSMWQNYFFVQDKWQATKKLVANLGLRWDRYLSMYPPQGNDGIGAFGTAFRVPERTLPIFNNWVPRLGLIYDLFGNTKTALKAAYGRYAEDPDITFALNANPNTTEITNRYAWDGTLPVTPALLAASKLLSTSGQVVPAAIDPHIKNAYDDEYLVGVDQELAKNFALTVDWVRMNRYATRVTVNRAAPTSGYTAVQAIDPGPDGVLGTADDRPWTAYERTVPAGTDNYLTNANTGEHYNTIDVSAHKRFAKGDELVIGGDRTTRILGDSTSYDPNTLQFNGPQRPRISQWDFKLFGTYSLPLSMSLSGSISLQKGEPYGRTVNLTPALLIGHPGALAQGSTTVTVQPSGSYYLPTIAQTTLHLERKFKGPVKGDAITAVFELYNIQNANTIIGVNGATGVTTNSLGQIVPTFGRYSQTLNPRIARLGVRYQF
jgi:carboxypeptidase family protein